MHRTLTRLAILLLALAATPGAAQSTAAPAPPAVPAPGFEDATLQPGDAVRIVIWREEDLSGEFAIDPAGRVVFPLLGELQVGGMPASVLRDTLISRYRQHLRNPSINITPLRRINVLGEVYRPGLYAVDPTITLAGAVALAGGVTPEGNLRHINIHRSGQPAQRVLSMERLDQVQMRSGDQIVVQRRGWFDRNSALVVSMLLSVTSIVVTVIQ